MPIRTVSLSLPLCLAVAFGASSTIVACGGGTFTPSEPEVADASASSSGSSSGKNPQPATYSLGGTVTGLRGAGLVLQNSAGDDLPIAADGSFVFPTKLASQTAFAVTVKTQPTVPSQTCTVTGGTGTVASGNVTSVTVNCAVDTFAVGGTISGLTGAGLTLQNNAGDNLVVNANGTFAFPTTVSSGAAYAVTVSAQPSNPTQSCVVTNGSGTVAASAVDGIVITCTTSTFTIGGVVSGLVGSGLQLADNGGVPLPIAGDGTFTFPAAVESGAAYEVTVVGQPTGPLQTCLVSGGTGTVGAANVESVLVNCDTNKFAIGGTATGLLGTVVLQNNEGDDLTVSNNGTFAFHTPIADLGAYAVTVKTQPGSPSQECSLTAASGNVAAAAVTSVALTCVTNSYTIKGTITGLLGAGLVLQNNAGDDVTAGADGPFVFPVKVDSGQAYAVTAQTQPTGPNQTCTVTNASGTVGAADVTNVVVTCTTNSYDVIVNVTGTGGGTIVLQNNAGDDLSLVGDGSASFTTKIPSDGTYAVTVKTLPADRYCVVASGSGTVTSADVTVAVTCSTEIFAFGEFRPKLACGSFVNNGNNYQQYCFPLKGQTLCIGQTQGGLIACTDLADGIRFTFDTARTWPMRFTANTASCENYDPAYVTNLANALGYATATINTTQTGNSCPLTHIDNAGLFQTAPGNSSLAEIYSIDFK